MDLLYALLLQVLWQTQVFLFVYVRLSSIFMEKCLLFAHVASCCMLKKWFYTVAVLFLVFEDKTSLQILFLIFFP